MDRAFLDPFRDSVDVETLGQDQYGLDDGGALLVFQHAFGEGLVDLDLLDREIAQIAQAGMARAEIVERNGNAGFRQLGQDAFGRFRVLHQRRFGDLQHQPSGRKFEFLQDGIDLGRQSRILQLHRRQIEGQVEIVRPGGGDLAGILQQMLGQLGDDAAVFGNRDELQRRHLAKIGICPSRKGLEPCDATGVHVQDWLVIGLHLMFRNCAAQTLFK